MSGPEAADAVEQLAGLAALPDDQLVAVLSAATAGRAALQPVHQALAQLAGEWEPSGFAPGSSAHDRASAAVDEDSADLIGSGPEVYPVDGDSVPGGCSPGGVPTFEAVRDRLEQRFGTAAGMTELDRHTEVGRSSEEQWEARERAARERLEQIRTSMRDGRAH